MSDYIDTVDIEGTQYDIQDTATKATAEQNAQDIDTLEGKTTFLVRNVSSQPYTIAGNGYVEATANATYAGYKLLFACVAHSGYAEGIPFGCSISGNTVTVRMKNLNPAQVSNVQASVQCLYQKI